jgi:hypothetical protein
MSVRLGDDVSDMSGRGQNKKKERTRHETLHVVQLSETWSQTLMVVRQCLTGACVLDKK